MSMKQEIAAGPGTTRRIVARTLFAGALLLFGAVVAPLASLTLTCSMPCCQGSAAASMQQTVNAPCTQPCGIARDRAPVEITATAAESSVAQHSSLVPLATIETSRDTTAAAKLRDLDTSLRLPVQRDTPLYLSNSVFLI